MTGQQARECLHSFVQYYSQEKTKQNRTRMFVLMVRGLVGGGRFIHKMFHFLSSKKNGQLENTEIMDCCA